MDKKVWRIKFYGTRGSTPVCEEGFQQFGGNTTCISIEMLLAKNLTKPIGIIDAGTGIRQLGKEIMANAELRNRNIFIMFTHFHWDHIQGLPFFDPAYKKGQKIMVFSPHHNIKRKKLKHIFEVQTQQEYFPIQLEKMGANFHFITDTNKAGDDMQVEGVDFSYRLHNHPGGAYSYSFVAHGKKVVICTDLEHGETINEEVVKFCKNADLLVHDAQYTDDELKTHRGWGHSSFGQVIELAKRSNVKQAIFTHHDPDHNDNFLSKIELECQKIFPNCKIARDGMEILV